MFPGFTSFLVKLRILKPQPQDQDLFATFFLRQMRENNEEQNLDNLIAKYDSEL